MATTAKTAIDGFDVIRSNATPGGGISQDKRDKMAAHYRGSYLATMDLYSKLGTAINRHRQDSKSGRGPNYAHAGDLAHIREGLQDALDFLNGGKE